MINTIIAHYKIVEKLGAGGMGVVYKAEDIKLKRLVALKFLSPQLTEDDDAKLRFEREAQAAAALNHPNIVTIHEINEHEGQVFIVMEYLEGQSLKDKIYHSIETIHLEAPGSEFQFSGKTQSEGKHEYSGLIPHLKETINILIQVCEGLAKAHEKGILHRDIKPGNIIITNDGIAKILDFGLAKLRGERKLTKDLAILGTVNYMSPEQCQGKEVDQRTDIWALGVMLFEMVSGQLPFRGEHPQATIYSIINNKTPSLSVLNPSVPEEMEKVVNKLLEKNADDRYQQVKDVLIDLKKLAVGRDISTAKVETVRAKSKPAIAVLPFKNMSADPENEYFGDGLAEELINALTQVKGLHVAARTSAFSFKGKEMDIREIGRQLNVDKLLEGSVRKSGKNIRITAQLINVADGFHIWSERFDRGLDDIFAIQDEISLNIVEKLKLELLSGEREKIVKRHTSNEKAYDLYLKGRYFWNRRYKGDMIKAVVFYQKAIDEDPHYALPYVGIADVFNIFGQWAFFHPREAHSKSKIMLQKALELDESLSELHSSLGFLTACYEWDLIKAEKHYLRSIELNPCNAYAHGWHSIALAIRRDKEAAIREAEKAVEIDPLFSLFNALNGIILAMSGQVEKGREKILHAINMEPDQPMPYLFLGIIYLLKPAVPEKAIEYLQRAEQSGILFALGWLGLAYAMANQKDKALNMLRKLEQIENENFLPLWRKMATFLVPGLKHFRFLKKKYVAPMLKAIIYVGLKMQEEALEHFEKSSNNRDYFLPVVFNAISKLDISASEEIFSHPRIKALQVNIKID